MQVKRKHIFIMKTKLQILVTVLSIAFSMAMASAQQPVPINPQTGLPEPGPGSDQATGGGGGGGGGASATTTTRQTRMFFNPQTGLPEPMPDIDPATGLPADGSPPFKDTNGVAAWIDPAWKDPAVVLDRVDFQSLPLIEVARQLRERFLQKLKVEYFDIILPTASDDPTLITVGLQLNNVTASEIFSAMNLQFELNKTPVRWELTLNGSRPTAILRDLPQLGPPPPPQIRKVFFVGDMLDEYPGTNDLNKLGDISGKLNDAWDETGISRGRVHVYPAGQLLIVSGTPDQVDLAEQILRALKEKEDFKNSLPQLVKPR